MRAAMPISRSRSVSGALHSPDRRGTALWADAAHQRPAHFGFGGGAAPAQAQATVHRTGPMNALVQWQPLAEMDAQGCNIRYGIAPDKLYQSWLVYGVQELDLSTLMAGQDYYLRVDSFNENGITEAACCIARRRTHK
mgnify:CR=1 FL=1